MKKIKKKSMNLAVNVVGTNEIFKLDLIYPSTSIRELRSETEIASGIPVNIQQLHYLDKCDLNDDETVLSSNIVWNATLTMEIWHIWKDLIAAVVANDIPKVFSMGVSQDSTFSTPSSQRLLDKERRVWLQERANMALMIAAHRGHLDLCTRLIQEGADVNWTTKLGRTPLHLAAARDQSDVIDLLLHKGADIELQDSLGLTPMTLANRYGHKGCERRLFMFRWQQRAKDTETKFLNPPLMAFQMSDSALPKWRTGPAAQFYCQKLLPPGEYLGTALNAPKRNWHRRSSIPAVSGDARSTEEEEAAAIRARKLDKWFKQKSRQARINNDIKKKKENSQREIEEEKLRQKRTKWAELREAESAVATYGQGRRDEAGDDRLGSEMRTVGDMKRRIKELLKTYGLLESDEVPKTVYEQWLQQRSNMGRPVHDTSQSNYEDCLPYQKMIREFCSKKCHSHVDGGD